MTSKLKLLQNISTSCLLLPIVFYPIPYFSKTLVSQPTFIRVCKLRVLLLILSNILYIVQKYGTSILAKTLLQMSSKSSTGLLLLTIGQIFNLSVYHRLGETGVYYGLQYGTVEKTTALSGFPFIIEHPMYFGGCLTYIGVYILLGKWSNSYLKRQLMIALGVQMYLQCMETTLDSIYVQ